MTGVALVLLLSPVNPAALTVPAPMLQAPPDRKELWIEELHRCENLYNEESVMDTNGKRSYGYVMFQMQTWLSYGKRFGATPENISSSTLQKKVARSMLDKGEFWHWKTCSARTEAKLGVYQ